MSSFLSQRQRLGRHRQTASTTDVPAVPSADLHRHNSANQGPHRGFQRFEARRTMDESQLLFPRPQPKELNPPVDYRALDYVSKHDENLVCPICRCPFVDPVILNECDHCFCRVCIRQSFAAHPLGPRGDCPTCRTPAKLGPRSATSKIIVNILDDLEVHCPKHAEGCEAVVKRGEVQDHVTLYCGYSLVECSGEECTQAVLRKNSSEGCLHYPVSCLECRQSMLKSTLSQHWKLECPDRQIYCTECDADVFYRELNEHKNESCPAISVACPGHEYGCTIRSRRAQLDNHVKECVFARLAPTLLAQKQRMDEHEVAQRQMSRKLDLLEQGLINIQRLLNPQLEGPDDSSADESRIPFLPGHRRTESFETAQTAMSVDDSNALEETMVGGYQIPRHMLDLDHDVSSLPAPSAHGPYTSPIHHLLSMHESLRDELTRISTALSEMDGRQSLQVINESLRNRDEMAYLGAQIAGVSRQVHWLTSAQLQRQQGRSNGQTGDLGESASAGVGVEAAVNAVANAASALRGAARMVGGTNSSTGSSVPEGGRMRRGTSEEGRTKL